jgi:2',3'-cyclic-nucleotide 2'-phosphodiesterase (5'-nucleotidase family)
MRLSPTLSRLQSAPALYLPPVKQARQGRFFDNLTNTVKRVLDPKASDKVRILSFNDVYKVPLLAQFYTLLEKELKNDPHFAIFFGGDTFSPSLASQKTKGKHMVDAMNVLIKNLKVPFVATLGNHEFDHGFKNLIALVKASNFSWLGANLYQDGQHLKEVPPYKIMKINGKRILVYGVVVDEIYNKLPENVSLKDPLSQIKSEVPDLKKKHRPDATILLGHLGEDYYKDLRKLSFLDLILVGHQHEAISQLEDGVPLLSADNDLRNYVDSTIHFKEKPLLWKKLNVLMNNTVHDRIPQSQVRKVEAKIVPVPPDTAVHPDVLNTIEPELKTWLDSMETPLARLGEPVDLEVKHIRQNQEIAGINFLADALRTGWNQKNAKQPVDAAILHAGCIRANRKLDEKILTKGALLEIFPYQEPAVRIKANGQLVKDLLEESCRHFSDDKIPTHHKGYAMTVSGLKVEGDMSKPFGERITSIHRAENNKPLTPQDSINLVMYRLLTQDEGGLKSLPAYVKANPGCVEEGQPLEDYIQHHLESLADGSTLPTISPKTDGRWQITPANPQ